MLRGVPEALERICVRRRKHKGGGETAIGNDEGGWTESALGKFVSICLGEGEGGGMGREGEEEEAGKEGRAMEEGERGRGKWEWGVSRYDAGRNCDVMLEAGQSAFGFGRCGKWKIRLSDV